MYQLTDYTNKLWFRLKITSHHLLTVSQPQAGAPTSEAGPPPSAANRPANQHFDIPGPDYITLSATINRGYAVRNVMIPLLSQNLLNSDQPEDLHR